MKIRRVLVMSIYVGVLVGWGAASMGCKSEEERAREKVAERAMTYHEHRLSGRFESAAQMGTPEDRAAVEGAEDVSGLHKLSRMFSMGPDLEATSVEIAEDGRTAHVVVRDDFDPPQEYDVDLVRIDGQWWIDTDAAEKKQAEAEETREDEAKALVRKAEVRRDQFGDFDEAKALLEKALEIDPDSRSAMYQMERVEERLDARVAGRWVRLGRDQKGDISLNSHVPEQEYVGQLHPANLSLDCNRRTSELEATVSFHDLNVEDEDEDGRVSISMTVGNTTKQLWTTVDRLRGTELTLEKPGVFVDLLVEGDELVMEMPFRAYREPQPWTFPVEGAETVAEMLRDECETSDADRAPAE